MKNNAFPDDLILSTFKPCMNVSIGKIISKQTLSMLTLSLSNSATETGLSLSVQWEWKTFPPWASMKNTVGASTESGRGLLEILQLLYGYLFAHLMNDTKRLLYRNWWPQRASHWSLPPQTSTQILHDSKWQQCWKWKKDTMTVKQSTLQ